MGVFLDRIYGINRIFSHNRVPGRMRERATAGRPEEQASRNEQVKGRGEQRIRDILQDTYSMTHRVIIPEIRFTQRDIDRQLWPICRRS